MKKLRVAVIFGGRSAEHEISLLSARNVVAALDKTKYEPVLIGIDRTGQWFLNDGSVQLLHAEDASHVELSNPSDQVGLISNGPGSRLQRLNGEQLGAIDVLFPVLHGPYGEDGTIQGLAKLADLPCVGAGVLGSAVGMDKDVMKRLLRDAGVPIAPFITIQAWTRDRVTYDEARELLGEVLYVKPANLGSSVGISRVHTAEEFETAVDTALKYDTKVVVEQAVVGREIECSVLGNEDPIASIPGEIVPRNGFYSYEAKYLDESGAVLQIPADLTPAQVTLVQSVAIQTFQVLCTSGMGRIDGFLTADDTFVVNEINTIPGFTRISMFPKLFEASGISTPELIDRLIELAIQRHRQEQALSLAPGTE